MAELLIMNLKQLRNVNFEEKFINLLSKYAFRVAQDQDYLNVICKNKVWYLNEKIIHQQVSKADKKINRLRLNLPRLRYRQLLLRLL